MPFRIKKLPFAMVSASHFKPSDRDLLTELCSDEKAHPLPDLNLAVYAYKPDTCWLVGFGSGLDIDDCEDLIAAGFSEEAVRLLRQLAEEHVYYVHIDVSGYPIEGAPFFD